MKYWDSGNLCNLTLFINSPSATLGTTRVSTICENGACRMVARSADGLENSLVVGNT